MTSSQIIIPALIPETKEAVKKYTEEFSFLHELHIDVVDGKFVSAQSWPYINESQIADVSSVLDPFTVEVDMMVEDPLRAGEDWISAGAQMLIFHIETLSCLALAAFSSKHTGVSIGISAYNDTPWESLREYLKQADYVQVMGIAEIGAQGSPFDKRCIDRIKKIQKEFPDLPISVDGSMNLDTIPKMADLEVDRFIVGSALIRVENKERRYQDLVQASTVQ